MDSILSVEWCSAHGHQGALVFYKHGRAMDKRTGDKFWYHTREGTLWLVGQHRFSVPLVAGWAEGSGCFVYNFPENVADVLDSSKRKVCVVSNDLYLEKSYSEFVDACDIVIRVNSCANLPTGIVGSRTDIIVVSDKLLTLQMVLSAGDMIETKACVLATEDVNYFPPFITDDVDRYSGFSAQRLTHLLPECIALSWAKLTLNPGSLYVVGDVKVKGVGIAPGVELDEDTKVRVQEFREHKEKVTGGSTILLADHHKEAALASAFFYDGKVVVICTNGRLLRKGKLLVGNADYVKIDWGDSTAEYYYNGRFFEVTDIKYCNN